MCQGYNFQNLSLVYILLTNYNIFIHCGFMTRLKTAKKEEEILMAKNVQLDAKGYRKFGMIDNLAYAAGDFGCNMSFALKGTMFIF